MRSSLDCILCFCRAIDQALRRPLNGRPDDLYRAVGNTDRILCLADNAGEMAFDLLLAERLGPHRVTVAVRGGPVLNDATLADCSPDFRHRFAATDLLVAKGQGNFE